MIEYMKNDIPKASRIIAVLMKKLCLYNFCNKGECGLFLRYNINIIFKIKKGKIAMFKKEIGISRKKYKNKMSLTGWYIK